MSDLEWFVLTIDTMLLVALIIALICSEKFRKDVINKENQNSGKIFNFITFSGTVIFVLSFLLIAIQYKILDNSLKSEKELCKTLGQERLILKLNGDLDTRMHERLFPAFKITEYDSILISSSRNAFIDSAHQRLIITTYDSSFHLGYISLNDPNLLNYYQSKQTSSIAKNKANDQIKQIAYDLFKLRTKYESIDDTDPTYQNLNRRDEFALKQVIENADKLRIQLRNINSARLSLPYWLLHNYYIAYLDCILAQHESGIQTKRIYLQEGISHAREAMQKVLEMYDDRTQGKEVKWHQWVETEHLKDVLHMTLAWLYAIQALADTQVTADDSSRIVGEYSQITGLYKERYPLDNNPSLRFFIKKE
ncbi:hypothetical protein GF407_06270 [candidate division KSB1 bacterium]|nr:hypothetical protein [candidate division KSB1 bacterium]